MKYVLLILLMLLPLSSMAEVNEPIPITEPGPNSPSPFEQDPIQLTSCSEHYTLGSVQVDVSPSVESTVNGVPITFSGKIINQNPYPIIDGAVYMKVFKIEKNDEPSPNDLSVVYQGFVLDNLNLAAASSTRTEFAWLVPASLPTGHYRASFFFVSNKSFYLLGLPFSDEVTGNTLSFDVAGEYDNGISFDKNEVTINNSEYHFAAYIPTIGTNDPAVIQTTLRNDTNLDKTIPVKFTTYAFDQLQKDNLIDEKEYIVNVRSKSSVVVEHTVRDNSNASYLIVAEAKMNDASSILNIRFSRENIPNLHINFAGINTYPLRQGYEYGMFACFQNLGTNDSTDNTKVILTLSDKNGQAVRTRTYEGSISSSMMAIADKFVPGSDMEKFSINAKIYHDEKLVDEANVFYDCNKLDRCIFQEQSQDFSPTENIFSNLFSIGATWLIALVSILGLLIIMFFILLLKYRRLRRTPTLQ